MTKKTILLCIVSIVFLFPLQCSNGNGTKLEAGKVLEFTHFKLEIKKISTGVSLSVQNEKAPEGKHYIVIESLIKALQKGKAVESGKFYLKSNNGRTYENPGSWGKIKLMGSEQNFNASPGSNTFIREENKLLNLYFIVPEGEKPESVSLEYQKTE